MVSQKDILAESSQVLIENYGRLPYAMVRGDGAKIWDADGREYLDFFPGFGAGGVGGHCHPKIVEAIQTQAGVLLSHGNLFTNEPQVDLAQRITKNGFGGKVFFCHSGGEANETALKLVRLAARGERRSDGPFKVISFSNCFHGRTMGGLSLTPQAFQVGFEPMVPGNVMVEYGNIAAVEAAMDDDTAGVFIEPIQAEGGMNVPTVEFMQQLRKLCDERNVLLVCDEVWTAPARTGKMFAYQHYGIEPDVMTLAKAIGGGTPMGVCVVSPKYADVLVPGTHGCTMGGNPLCAAAGAAAMKLIEDENLLTRAVDLGEKAMQQLTAADLPGVAEIRGKGLMIGLELEESFPAADIWKKCMEAGLIICVAKNNVLRVAPPLTIEQDVLGQGLEILIKVMKGHGRAGK
ncbi:MAG: acetylornithine/succinylornithine family transaminase [Phycisphaerae bacterium]|nr:acetylornithine/succinylornithine family transaminase [Phycisphaerae bacterium]